MLEIKNMRTIENIRALESLIPGIVSSWENIQYFRDFKDLDDEYKEFINFCEFYTVHAKEDIEVTEVRKTWNEEEGKEDEEEYKIIKTCYVYVITVWNMTKEEYDVKVKEFLESKNKNNE